MDASEMPISATASSTTWAESAASATASSRSPSRSSSSRSCCRARTANDATVAHDLLSEWPRYLSYLAAFAVIGYTWMVHHQLFEVIRRVDTAAIWINLALLSFVVLTPYPMQLLGRQPTLAAPYVLFNLDAFLFGVVNYLLVLYATDEHRLVWHRLPARGLQILRWRAAVFPLAIGVATVLAVPFGAWSVLAWGLVPFGRWLVRTATRCARRARSGRR